MRHVNSVKISLPETKAEIFFCPDNIFVQKICRQQKFILENGGKDKYIDGKEQITKSGK